MIALDRGGMAGHLEGFPDQLREARGIGGGAVLTLPGQGARAVVVTGMGGSAIGGEIAAACLSGTMPVPCAVVRGYDVPAYVDRDTVVVAASYSGSTEETLSAYRGAASRQARIVCITTGGELARLARAAGHDVVEIPPGLPPRAALGYSLIPLLMVLARLGLAPDPASDVDDAIAAARRAVAAYGLGVPLGSNPAKQLAAWFRGGIPVIYGSVPLTTAVATRWCGQISENAKTVAHRNELPEMDHNEIVGWSGARPLGGRARVVFLRDAGDHPRVGKRVAITRREIEAAGAEVKEAEGTGASALGRALSLVALGDFTSFYLAVLAGVDPTPVEPIDRLKKALADA